MTEAEVGPVLEDQAPSNLTAWVDVDNDGWPELYRNVMDPLTSYPNYSWTNEVYHLGGDGKFYPMDIGEMKKGSLGYTTIAWADYDNDGFLDGVVWADQEPLGLYRNLAAPLQHEPHDRLHCLVVARAGSRCRRHHRQPALLGFHCRQIHQRLNAGARLRIAAR